MAEGDTESKRGRTRSWWFPAALVATVAVAGIVAFFILRDWQRARLSFRVDEHVSMHLVSVLHDGNEELEPRAWLRKLYGLLPEKVKSKTKAWQPELVLIKEDLEESAVALIFKPQVRRSSSTAPGKAGLRQQANSSALSSDIGLRLRFANGGYTGIESMSSLQNHQSTGDGWGYFFGCAFDPIPLTAKDLTVEVVRGETNAIEVMRQVKIPNPAYREMQPIGAATSLPAIVTHDGVSVTLEALVSNTVSGLVKKPAGVYDNYADLWGVHVEQQADSETLQFRRHDGKAVRPSCTAVAVRVNDTGSTGSAWRVHKLRFLYGDGNIIYPQPRHWNLQNMELDRGLVQIFTFPNDVGVIGQPVKVIAQLIRQRDFPAEDMITFSTELPTTGTFTTETSMPANHGAGLQGQSSSDHRTDLYIANQAAIPYTQMDTNQEGLLTVQLMSHNESAHIFEVKMTSFDGSQLDLSKYLLDEAQRQKPVHTYDLHNRTHNPETPAIDSARIDKIQVTVVEPRMFTAEFEFIADPTEAQLPAVSGIY